MNAWRVPYRLRSRCAELELANDELTKQMSKLDEDRADVASFLNRILQEKEALIEELQDRIQGLIEVRQVTNSNTSSVRSCVRR